MSKSTGVIYTTIALKLHAFGLKRLHDPNWTGVTLFDELKQHIRGRREPTSILFKTIENGLLYHLGLWLYCEYLQSEYYFESLRNEYIAWYLEDYLDYLLFHQVDDQRKLLHRLGKELQRISKLYDRSEERYFKYLESEHEVGTLHSYWQEIQDEFWEQVASLEALYAANYADRVFHDRQLCGYIAHLIVIIGFDGATPERDEPQQWINRDVIPEWAKKALYARERDNCALCSVNIIAELEDAVHIDHIVPLYLGGSNDLVNLQMLCKRCNLHKSTHHMEVRTSIPPYMQRRLVKASKN